MNLRKVEVYLNITFNPLHAFFNYHDGDDMRCAWRGELDLPADDNQALHILWAMMNVREADAESPNDAEFAKASVKRMGGYDDRSLSVADVVTLDERQSYAVESLDFRQIEPLLTGDPIQGPEVDYALAAAINSQPLAHKEDCYHADCDEDDDDVHRCFTWDECPECGASRKVRIITNYGEKHG